MVPSSSSDLPQKSFHIKQDDKFFCRLLSKESSTANPSLRVYYGGSSGEVPFLWESRPGTPKNTTPCCTIPPLTPPPSFLSQPKKADLKKPSKPRILTTILPKLTLRKTGAPSSPVSSSPPPLFSSHSGFSPIRRSTSSGGSRVSSTSSSSTSMGGDDGNSGEASPTSILCFGAGIGEAGGFGGSYKMVGVKKALLAIIGHGSSRGAT